MPNIGTTEEQQLYEMLQDLWARIGSVDDVFEEVSGYAQGMRKLKAENEVLRDAARAFYDATQAGGAGTNGILIGQDAVSRLNRTADDLEKALAAHDQGGDR